MGRGGREEGGEILQLEQQGQPRRLCLAWLRKAYVRGLVSGFRTERLFFLRGEGGPQAGPLPGCCLERARMFPRVLPQ